LIISSLFLLSPLYAQQIVLEEDFEDQDLTQNPEWTGDLQDFIFVEDDQNILLRLNAPEAGTSQLRTASSTAYGTWEFFIDQDFPPSNGNRGFIFLISDREDLSGEVNGYAIRTGENSSPNFFRLFRFTNGTGTEILTGELDISQGGGYQLRVTRDDEGEWSLYESEGFGSLPQFTGSAFDDTHTESSFFGFQLNYTITRAENFYFDNIIIRDGILPLKIAKVNVETGNSLRVIFTEQVDESSVQSSDFLLNGIESNSATLDQENQTDIILEFHEGLAEGENSLSISNIDDFRGNTIEPVDFEFTILSPFFIETIESVDATGIEIEFSEAPKEEDLLISSFFVDGKGNPQSIEYDSDTNPELIKLVFESIFEDGDYELSVIENIRSINNWNLGGETELDLTVKNPFEVISFTAVSNQEIDITFTEDIEQSFIDDPTHFTVAGIGSPDSAESVSDGTIRLLFDPALNAGSYTLTIGDIRSVNNWPLSGENEFEFTVFDEFEAGDLLITEFFYRVPIDWRTDEFNRPAYLEILNRSDKLLNLKDFTINGESISSTADVPVLPDEYIVITRGKPVFLEKFGERNFYEAEEFPSLALTTPNEIILRTEQGITADSLVYDPGLWGGNGVSLERRSSEVSSLFRDNWAESTDALLGSPGLPNTVSVPEDSPEVVDITFLLPLEMSVEFSRELSKESVEQLGNFTLDNGALFESVRYESNKRILTFELKEQLLDLIDYTFNYNEVEDIFGNGVDGPGEFDFRFMNPFRVLKGDVLFGNRVSIEFTQPLNISTVSVSDFSLVDGTGAIGVEFPNSEKAVVEFAEDFENGAYTLLINDVHSMVGWPIEPNTEFRFFIFEDYEPGDILINEFMYNLPAGVGYSRYVELINVSEKVLNLRDWELRREAGAPNNGGVISSEDLGIEPGELLVLTGDTTALSNIFGSRNWFQMQSFPSFAQTADDEVRLIDHNGNIADSLRYERSIWGGTDVALERRSTAVSAVFSENWGESPNELLGTPGLPNEVEPDKDAPIFTDLATFRDDGFILTFNKRLNADSATNLQNYSISPSLPVSLVAHNNNRVTIFAGNDLIDNEIYEITVEGISDLFGNVMEVSSRSVEYFDFQEAEPQQIVINEILYRRLQSGAPEFVEILNRTENNIDLTGWTLSDSSGSSTIPSGTVIRGNGYLVLTDTESFAAEDDQIIYMSNWPGFSNNGDAVVIMNSVQTVIDSVFYQPTWGDNTAGVSLERRDPSALSIDPANWAPSLAQSGSTPVAENSRFEEDHTSPEIIFANLFHPDSLEVRFNKFVDITSSGGSNPDLYTSSKYAIPKMSTELEDVRFLINGIAVNILLYNPLSGNRVVLDGSGVSAGEEISITIENFRDFKGNITYQQTQPVAQPLSEGDLVFNEIMYNPLSDNRDGLPNQSEYIEIYNRRPFAISLEGIFLHDEPDENNQITRIDPVGTSSRWIPANGYVIIYPETVPVSLQNSRTGIFFELSEEQDLFGLRVERNSLSLPNGGRQIYLADSTGRTIDMVDYGPEWHNPNLISNQGIALERINPDFESNDPANWGSSTNTLGGTPGFENTLYQNQGLPPEGVGISLSPNPFSPDGDGFEDNLIINYTLDEPDYLLRIRIYDRYGRLVRNLADGLNAGLSGSVIWDGLTDSGSRNRIGIYIIYVEAYNSANGNRRAFRETAVLARQF
jgi:hypothetical protein